MPQKLRRDVSVAALLVWGGAVAACDGSPTGGDPRVVPPIVMLAGSTIVDTLPRGGVRDYRVLASAGTMLRIFFQATSGSSSDSLVATVRLDSAGAVLGTLTTNGTQASLTDRVLRLPPTASVQLYTVSVRGAGTDDRGSFTLQAAYPDFGTETVPVAFPLGDTVTTEQLDALVEFDRFEIQAEAGQEYVAAISPLATMPGREIHLHISEKLGPDTFEQISQRVFPWSPASLEVNSTRFMATSTRTHVVSVSAPAIGPPVPPAIVDGRYRLWVRKIDTLPELRPALITVGDTVLETIAPVNDIDHFTFAAVANTDYRLDVSWTRTQSPHFTVGVFTPNGGYVDGAELTVPPSRLDGRGFSFRPATSGMWRVRVRGQGGNTIDSVTTPYRLELRTIARAPETRGATLTANDTIVTEAIERAGDIDEFSIAVTLGSSFAVHVIRDVDFDGDLRVVAVEPALQESVRGAVGPANTSLDLTPASPRYSARFGPYGSLAATLRIEGVASARGSYRIETRPIDPLPEVVAPTLPIGPWVSGETLSPAEDLDYFEFPVVAGKLYNVAIAVDAGVALSPILFMHSLEANAVIAPWTGGATGPMLAVENGIARFHVERESSTLNGDTTPAYRVMAYVIDSMPESVPGARTLGDTIIGESIGGPGDVDSFTFAADSGDKVRLQFAPEPADSSVASVVASLYEPGTGALLVGTSGGSSATVTLQRTGTFTVRVRDWSDRSLSALGPYRLILERVP